METKMVRRERRWEELEEKEEEEKKREKSFGRERGEDSSYKRPDCWLGQSLQTGLSPRNGRGHKTRRWVVRSFLPFWVIYTAASQHNNNSEALPSRAARQRAGSGSLCVYFR